MKNDKNNKKHQKAGLSIDKAFDDGIPDYERLIIDFTLGRRKPKTKSEKELYDEIQEIQKRGHIVDIPGEVW